MKVKKAVSGGGPVHLRLRFGVTRDPFYLRFAWVGREDSGVPPCMHRAETDDEGAAPCEGAHAACVPAGWLSLAQLSLWCPKRANLVQTRSFVSISPSNTPGLGTTGEVEEKVSRARHRSC